MEVFANFVLVAFSILRISISVDTMTVNQIIRDGDTITSPGGSFELGFFSPDNSKNRYLGIWYKKVATGTVVWVANRQIPLTHSSGVSNLTDQGLKKPNSKLPPAEVMVSPSLIFLFTFMVSSAMETLRGRIQLQLL